MTVARAQFVDPDVSGLYHCISRCVRRAFLFRDESCHRKVWLRDQLMHLADAFAIDVGGYAVLDNHFHTVLRTQPERAAQWSAMQVAERWFRIFPRSIRQWAMIAAAREAGQHDPADDQAAVRLVAADPRRIETLRLRLSSLSWFMKCLKERIARRANREDGCRGHFWEARFKSLRVLDPGALLATLLYVDLNVIRAAKAMTPESSDYTSAQDRIHVRQLFEKQRRRRGRAPSRVASLLRGGERRRELHTMRDPEDGIWLAPIDAHQHRDGLLEMRLDDYLTALDLSGRMLARGKRGTIPPGLVPILDPRASRNRRKGLGGRDPRRGAPARNRRRRADCPSDGSGAAWCAARRRGDEHPPA